MGAIAGWNKGLATRSHLLARRRFSLVLLGALWGTPPLWSACDPAQVFQYLQQEDVACAREIMKGWDSCQLAIALSGAPSRHMAQVLVALGAPPQGCSSPVSTNPLELAIFSDRLGVIEYLLEFPGVDANGTFFDGKTLLHSARSRGVAEALVRHGAKVNTPDAEGRTPLHTAVLELNREADSLVAFLSTVPGVDCNARDKEGNTPLHDARSPAQVQYLLECGGNLFAENNEGELAILSILENDLLATTAMALPGRDWLKWRDSQGSTLLQRAVARGYGHSTARRLIEHGAEVNSSNHQGQSIVYSALAHTWKSGKPNPRRDRAYVEKLLRLLFAAGAKADPAAIEEANRRGFGDLLEALTRDEDGEGAKLRRKLASAKARAAQDDREPDGGEDYSEDVPPAPPTALPAQEGAAQLAQQATQELDGGNFKAAIEHAREALAQAKRSQDRTSEAKSQILMGRLSLYFGLASQAVTAFSEGLRLRAEPGANPDRAEALNWRGQALTLLGRYSAAIEDHRQALTDFRSLALRQQESAALYNLATNDMYLGRTKEAYDLYQEALGISQRIGDREGEIDLLSALGVYYTETGDSIRAVDAIERALALGASGHQKSVLLLRSGSIYAAAGRLRIAKTNLTTALESFSSPADFRLRAETLLSLSGVEHWLAEHGQALDYATQGRDLYRSLGDRSGEARGQLQIGLISQSLGQYQSAIDVCSTASSLFHAAAEPSMEAAACRCLANAHLSIGEFEEAAAQAQRALALYQDLGRPDDIASTLLNIAAVEEGRGDRNRAATMLNQVLRLFEILGNRQGQLDAKRGLGVLALNGGDYTTASQLLGEALVIARSLSAKSREAPLLREIGITHFFQNDFESALGEFQEALALAREASDHVQELALLEDLGSTQQRLGQNGEALESLRRAVAFEESIRSDLRKEESRQKYFAHRVGAMTLLASLTATFAIDGHGAPPFTLTKAGVDYASASFHYAEMARARTFLEILGHSKAGSLLLSEDLRRQEARLVDQQQEALHRLTGSDHLPGIDPVSYPDATEQLNRFISQLRGSPDEAVRAYAALRYPSPARAQDIPLAADEVLIEYLVLQDRTMIWILEPGRPVRVQSVSEPAEVLGRVVQRARVALEEEFPLPEADLEFLYDRWVAPALAQLAPGKRLLIVPDGPLALLPIDVLGHHTESGWRYLIEERLLTYLPSATALALLRTAGAGPHPPSGKGLLAFGEPPYGELAGRLPPLPATAEEVHRVATRFGLLDGDSRLKLGTDARESTLKKMSQRGELASFEYLHFATHAILGREGLGIGQPALVLAQTGDTGEDGFLTMSEVAELKIGAKMVVLSACDTGLGEDVPGEGLVGLARAFLFAGARSLVVSLWGVGDSTTALLMDRFYAGILESGLSPAKALRQARLEVLSRHPFHWGGFVLVGEP